jgi:hypothetical protein
VAVAEFFTAITGLGALIIKYSSTGRLRKHFGRM